MSMVEPLLPWASDAAPTSPLDRQLGRLFAAVPEAAPLSDFARERVGRSLRRRPARRAGLLLMRLVLVGAVIGVAGAAAAQWTVKRFFMSQRELVLPRAGAVTPAAPRRLPLGAPPAPTEAADAPAAPLEPSESPEPQPRAAVAPALPSSKSSALGLEAASLEAALSTLRAGGIPSAARALASIDQHLRAFPRGALELEARVARVDALLVLGRRQDARRELGSLPLERAGRSRELRLIRAELLADDDCRAALVDFQQLVLQPLPAAWAERALFGRGACLLRLGERAAAERDFASYLERYPNGRFAQQIRGQAAK